MPAGTRAYRRPYRYNWDKWLGGGVGSEVLLRFGKDYACTTSMMRQQLFNQASKRGLRLELDETLDSVRVRVVGTKPLPPWLGGPGVNRKEKPGATNQTNQQEKG